MKTLTQFFLAWCALTTLVFIGCESTTDDQINKAQACLNQADTSSEATDCLPIIENVSGEKAARIRCALTFIVNGLTQQQIINTFKNLKEPPLGTAPFVSLYAGLSIGDQDAGNDWDGDNRLTEVDDQLAICKASNSPSMVSIAYISRLGTYTQKQIDAVGTGDVGNIGQMDDPAVLDALPDDVLVEMGQYTFNEYCNGGNENESEICETLINAGFGTSADAATLAENLRSCFDDNNCSN